MDGSLDWVRVCVGTDLRINFTCTPPIVPRGGTEATLVEFDLRKPPWEAGRNDRASDREVGPVQAYIQQRENPSETLWSKVKGPRQELAKVTPDRGMTMQPVGRTVSSDSRWIVKHLEDLGPRSRR